MVFSGIATQHADDGYSATSKCGNFGGLLVFDRWHPYLWFKRWEV